MEQFRPITFPVPATQSAGPYWGIRVPWDPVGGATIAWTTSESERPCNGQSQLVADVSLGPDTTNGNDTRES